MEQMIHLFKKKTSGEIVCQGRVGKVLFTGGASMNPLLN